MAEEIIVIVDDTQEEVSLFVDQGGNGITKHSELILDDGTNPHNTTKIDVGLSNVPNTDFTTPVSLNTVKVTNIDTQVYAQVFFIDANTITQWVSTFKEDGANNEYTQIAGVLKTDSMIGVTASNLKNVRPLGVANGNQTINNFLLWSGETVGTQFITNISIFKATFSSALVISSITILYENTVTLTNGYLSLTDTDFTSTSINDKDLIYIYYGGSDAAHISPNTHILKCTID